MAALQGSQAYIKSTAYGHVAYQMKGNEAYNNMLANILPLHTPVTPGVGSKVNFYPPTDKVRGYSDQPGIRLSVDKRLCAQ